MQGWSVLSTVDYDSIFTDDKYAKELRDFVGQLVQLAEISPFQGLEDPIHAPKHLERLKKYLTEEDIARFQPIKEFITSMQSMGLSDEQIASKLEYDPEKGIQPTATSDTHKIVKSTSSSIRISLPNHDSPTV